MKLVVNYFWQKLLAKYFEYTIAAQFGDIFESFLTRIWQNVHSRMKMITHVHCGPMQILHSL